MDKLYVITKYLTFPGALVRGFWEHIVCRACGIPVEDNRLLRSDELIGHVEHELAPTSRKAFAVCFVPAFLNGLVALILTMSSVVSLFAFSMSSIAATISDILGVWFAFSLFVNSYPLVEDALNMKEKIYKSGTVIQKIFYAPGFAFLYIGAFLEKYLITFLLALACLIFLIVN